MMKKILSLILGLFFALSFSSGLAFAEDEEEEKEVNPVEQPTIPVPDFLPAPDVGTTGTETQNYLLNETVPRAINIGIGILSITAFIGILISAIQMLTAYGNDEKLNRAKTNLRYSLIGLLVIMLSYAIVSIVVSLALPNEEDAESFIPSAYALDDEALEILLPSQQKLIEEQDEQGRVSLPGGDFLGEVVPAIITNMMYITAFLIFIAFMYGGVLLVIGRGNEESITKAKNIIIYASIALALISLGFALVYGIATLNLTEDENSASDDVFVDTEERNE